MHDYLFIFFFSLSKKISEKLSRDNSIKINIYLVIIERERVKQTETLLISCINTKCLRFRIF